MSHQTVGYLWPMGPWYWLADTLGLPDWVAQRLWLGALLFTAGAGVVFLLRSIGWLRPDAGDGAWAGAAVAAFAYALSPYVLDYAARISAILLPWAGLGWLLGLAARALRDGGWRWPACFALVAMTVGGINATALVLAGLAPVLWFPYAVWVAEEAPLGRALATVGRIGLLTVGTALWWMAGLMAQGRYGIPILRYTETYQTVASTATTPELLRGLGYWFFYGSDKLGPWIEPNVTYTTNVLVLATSFAVPVLALLAAGFVRWRHRLFFVGLVVAGVAVGSGAHPYDAPSLYGRAFKALMGIEAGNALRSSPRAVPLSALGLAVLLGAGAAALVRASGRRGMLAAGAVVVLTAVNLPPLWLGQMYGRNLQRPEAIPAYWRQAAAFLDQRGAGTRVLELPGADFASYRWGNTVDPVTPGLMDRPYVARELIPWGGPASADLVNALDRRLQEGTFEGASLAPIARLMAAGDVVVRSDLQYERYRTPRPRTLWALLADPVRTPGLGRPTGFGDPVPNRAGPEFPLLDEIELGTPASAPDPPPVAVLPVEGARGIVRTLPSERPLIVSGNGDGLVEAAAAGLLPDDAAILFSARLTAPGAPPGQLAEALALGADLLLTDSNRRQARRWSTVRENLGLTEQAGEVPLVADPTDNRLELFPGAGDDAATVAVHRQVARVQASAYGNPVSYTPEQRPVNALDGDPSTAWTVGAFDDVRGERLLVELAAPTTLDHLTLLQPGGLRNRWITKVRLRFTDPGGAASALDVVLDGSSRVEPGQRVEFAARTVTTVELEILDTDVGARPTYRALAGVGFAEIGIPGVVVDEAVRLPRDLLAAVGGRSADHRLTILLSRQRSDPAEPVRSDEEPRLVRLFELPTPRSFTVAGTVRVAATIPDDLIDGFLGIADVDRGGVTVTSSGRLPGSLASRGSSAIDGDPSTAWVTPFGPQEGAWLQVDSARTFTVQRMDLRVLADGRHSVPTRLAVSMDGGAPQVVELPDVPDDPARRGAVASVPVTLASPLTGRSLRVTVEAVRAVTTRDYYSEGPIAMPVGLAELGISGVRRPMPEGLRSECRTDLVAIDGVAVPVRVSAAATATAAVARDGLALEGCAPVRLDAGVHELRTAPGRETGLDVDRLVLDAPGRLPAPTRPAPPALTVTAERRTGYELSIPAPGERPFWLVLGQSENPGWRATVRPAAPGTEAGATGAGGTGAGATEVDLGPPRLVNGYANGWLVTPPAGGGPIVVTLAWVPQTTVSAALVASAGVAACCLALALVAGRRPRVPVTAAAGTAGDPELDLSRAAGRGAGLVTVSLLAAGAFVLGGVLATGTVAVTAWCLLARPRRTVRAVRLLPALLVGSCAAFVVVRQVRFSLPAGFEWPTYFEAAHGVGWMALAALVTVAVLDRTPAGRAPRPGAGPARRATRTPGRPQP